MGYEESEQNIQKAIIDYLRIKKYVVFKHHSTGFTVREGKVAAFRYSEKGISDIIACSPQGTFVAIEVKKPGNKPSEDQLAFIKQVILNKGIAFVAHSIDETIERLASFEDSARATKH